MKTKLTYKKRNWLAGFTDGEGSIIICRNNEKRRNGKVYHQIYPLVILANTYKPAMDYVVNLLENRGSYYKQIRKKSWKICYILKLIKNDARYFIKLIYPYLKIKKKQAKLCLELLKTVRPNRHKKLHKRTLNKRLSLLLKCKKLNKRGR